MFAVIKTGGKQYRVTADQELTIERLSAEPGDVVQFNDVLMIGDEAGLRVGAPLVAGAGVKAEVLEETRGPKVYTFHKRRRKHSSKRLRGHRQSLTVVKVTEILVSGADGSGVKPALGSAEAQRGQAAAAAE